MLDAVGRRPGRDRAGLATVDVPGRMERVDAGQDFTAVVDYSHKPAAVALALDAVHAQLTATTARAGCWWCSAAVATATPASAR